MRICVVVPMHNEVAIAKESIETIFRFVEKLPLGVTLLVVNDGSIDGTKEVVEHLVSELGNKEKLNIISHEINKGYGAALHTGIKFAVNENYDYVLFMDSDLTNHPRYIEDFYKKMEEGWGYIKASRYCKGGHVVGVPMKKRIISTCGNFIARLLFRLPLTDYTNGFHAVKVELLRQMKLKETGFVIIMEELFAVKYLTDSICEIPYTLTSRKEGLGVAHFSYSIDVCMQYFKYAWKSFVKDLLCLIGKGGENGNG